MAACSGLNASASDPPGADTAGRSGPEQSTDLSIEQSTAEELALAAQMRADYPDDDDALLFQGRVHRGQGRSAEAERCWQQVLKINPKHARAYHELAVLAKDHGQFEQAMGYWRRAVRLQPQRVIMRTMLGEVLLELNKSDEALVELRRGLPADPESAGWHYVVAEGHLQLKEYAEAKAHYEKAIALLPQHTSSYYGLAKACMRLGLKDEAAKHLDAFRRLQAADDMAWRRTAVSQTEQQRSTGRLARRLIEAGRLYRGKGNPERAEAAFKRAVKLQPQQRAPREQLARLYLETRQEELALEQYEMISRNDPEKIGPYMNMGKIRARRQELPQAKAAYEKVIELAPDRDLGYRHLARLYLALGTQPKEARHLMDKAIGLQPSAENYYYLAWACGACRDVEAALLAIQEAIRLKPANQNYRQVLRDLKRGPQ